MGSRHGPGGGGKTYTYHREVLVVHIQDSPWFDMLSITAELRKCDQFPRSDVLEDLWPAGAFSDFARNLVSEGYINTIRGMSEHFVSALEAMSPLGPYMFNQATATQFVSLVKKNEECRAILWDSIDCYLQECMEGPDPLAVLEDEELSTNCLDEHKGEDPRCQFLFFLDYHCGPSC